MAYQYQSESDLEEKIIRIEQLSEIVQYKDPKIQKKFHKVIKKIRKDGIQSIMKKSGEDE